MTLLKWLPLRVVDKLILLMAKLTLGNTDKLGQRWPKTAPLELKNATRKTPVLETGALSLIKSGNIKVLEQGGRELTSNGARFMDGQEIAFDSIVLATGYKSNVPFWLKIVFGCCWFCDCHCCRSAAECAGIYAAVSSAEIAADQPVVPFILELYVAGAAGLPYSDCC